MQPTSELDEPYSQAGATATPWSDVQEVLSAADIFWLTTVRADGRPHVTPLVSVWLDAGMYFCTGPDEQKAVNLRANQKVVLTTGCNGWESGTDVVVEGTASRVTDDALLGRLAQVWATKWDGFWQFSVRDGAFVSTDGEGAGDPGEDGGGPAHVFRVAIDKVLSFDKEGGAATRHRMT